MRIVASLVAIIFCVQISFSQSVVIPSSNAGLSGGNNSLHRKPFGSYYGYERSAFIYSAYELGLMDTVEITAIGFYVDSLNSSIAANTPIKIYLKDVADTLFNAPTTFANEASGATLIFNGTLSSSFFTDENWATINFINSYTHLQNKSLEILIETNAGGSGSDGTPVSKGFRYNTTSIKRFQYWQQDNTAPSGSGTLDTLRPNITINYQATTQCTGTPVAGTISVSDTAVCSGNTIDFILQGGTTGSGIFYQWLKSVDGINFTSISNANQPNYTETISDTTYFICIIGCGTNYDTSAAVFVNNLLPVYCYCTTSLGGGCSGYSIDSLSIQGTSFNASLSGCENNTAPHYSSYPASGNFTTTLTAGQTYTMTIRQTGNNITSLWIDHNHDGVFGTSEWTQLNTTSVTNGTISTSFTLPVGAYNGLTGMRVRSRASGVLNDSTTSCSGFTSGETEDFLISITGGETIGINENIAIEDVTIYPNPNSGKFVIAAEGQYLLEIRDVLGKTVFNQVVFDASGKIELNLNFNAGIYFVKGINIVNRKAFTGKIVVE